MSDTDDVGREELIFPKIVDIIRRTHEPWTTDKNGNEIDPEWEQTSIVRAHDLIVELIEAYARQVAIGELEKLPTLIARIKDQENTPEYLVVDAREITKAIARLNEEHDQPNN